MSETFLSVKSAARRYGVCERTIRRKIAAGEMEAVRLGPRSIRIPISELERVAQPLAAHVANVVDSWPPLTPEQIDRVAVLLRPVAATA